MKRIIYIVPILFLALVLSASLSWGEWVDADGRGRDNINVSHTPRDSFWPSLYLDSLHHYPHIVWYDERTFYEEIYYKYWDGTSWQVLGGNVNVSNTSDRSARGSLFLDSSGNPHIAWYEDKDGNYEIYYKYWDGSSWQTLGGDVNMSHTITSSDSPSLALDTSNNPHIAWSDYSEGNYEIYYLEWDPDIVPGGAWVDSYGSSGQENINISHTTGDSYGPSLYLNSLNHPHIAWRDDTEGNYEIYYKYWNEGSWETLGEDINISHTPGASRWPSLYLDSTNHPHIAWEDDTEGISSVYYKYWDGSNWQMLGGDVNVSHTNWSNSPSLVLDSSGNPHITWHDYTYPNWEIYYKYWDGSSWQVLGGDVNVSHTVGYSGHPSLFLDSSGNPHIAWNDETEGNYEICYLYWRELEEEGSEGWPMFHHNPANTGYTSAKSSVRCEGVRELWHFDTDGEMIQPSPAIADLDGDGDLDVVIGSHDSSSSHIYALDGEEGDELWRWEWLGGRACIMASPAIAELDGDENPEVIFCSSDYQVYAVNGEDGSEVWNFSPDYTMFSSPVVADIDGDGKPEIVFGAGRYYYALNGEEEPEDGRVLWSFEGPEGVVGLFSTPAVGDLDNDGNLEVVFGYGVYLYAVNGEDGSEFWPSPFEARYLIVSSPAIADIDGDGNLEVVFGSSDNNAYCLNGENGSELWRFERESWDGCPTFASSSPAIADIDRDGDLEVVIGYGYYLYALEGNDGSEIWQFRTERILESSPAIADINGDGNLEVVFGSLDYNIYCLNGNDGSELWNYPTGYWIRSSPAIADVNGDGRLDVVIGSNDGKVYALTMPEGFRRGVLPGDSGGSGGSCFIATAAYTGESEKVRKWESGREGSPVIILQNFRDKCLLTNSIGQSLVKFYYRHSPKVADFIRDKESLKAVVRVELKPLIWLIRKAID